MSSTETITLLFTDLVGSTELWSRVGPAPAEDLRREHFDLLREAFSRHGGREVKSLGDGMMVAFESVGQAVDGAVEIQEQLERRNRRAEHALAVRVGVAHGDANREEDDFFGRPVIEAARLCAKAAGGQILATELVRLIAGSGTQFEPAGAFELKGLPGTVTAFEVVWEPLPDEASAPLPLPTRLAGVPDVSFVGREREREELAQLVAADSPARIALVSGEPGVGKTRIAIYAALRAREGGATVLYGRCDEDLGVAYGPWIEVLRHYVEHAPLEILRAHVAAHDGELCRLVPDLAQRCPDAPIPRHADADTERYALFEAATALLEGAAGDSPLVIVLDDLHAADRPSLALLRHALQSPRRIPLVVLATLRESGVSHAHPLSELLAQLHRDGPSPTRIKLDGLQDEDIIALLEAVTGAPMEARGIALARELRRETDGNPFFVTELLRDMVETGRVGQAEDGRWELRAAPTELRLPQSVREVVGRRVARLGPEASRALGVAAVIGRDFDLDLLGRTLGHDEDELLDLLEDAVGATLISERPGRPGSFMFVHALVEHTLYEDLGATRRARTHRRVAEALEELCEGDPGQRVGELARHWALAVDAVDADKAVDYALLAGHRAIDQLAPDEALRWFGQALDLLDSRDGGRRRDALIGRGEAQRQVGDPGYRETLLEAARLAERDDDHGDLARAMLATSRTFPSSLGHRDEELIAALEAAIAALPADDERRGRLLAQLSMEIATSEPLARRRQLADEALEIVRRKGDARDRCTVLLYHLLATWVAHTIDERVAHIDEMLALSEQIDDPILRFYTLTRASNVIEAADVAAADERLAEMRGIADRFPQPLIRWICLYTESPRALLAGRLDDAERLAGEAVQVATDSGQPDAMVFFGAVLCELRWYQGRLGELVDLIAQSVRDNPTLPAFRAAYARALVQSNRAEEARALLREVAADDFASVPMDMAWSTTLVHWSELAFILRDRNAAATLFELLRPHAHTVAWNGASICGSVEGYLGLLATALGHYDAAAAHFDAAIRVHERINAPIFAASNQVGLATALRLRADTRDEQRIGSLLEAARATAAEFGAGFVEQQAAALLAGGADLLPPIS